MSREVVYDEAGETPRPSPEPALAAPPVIVPTARLAPELLRALLVDFVTRDGTDYGLVEASLEGKIADVHAQLARGEVVLAFDPVSETCGFVLASPG